MLNVDNLPFQVAIAYISSKEKGKIKCSMGMDKQDGIDTMLLEHPLRDTDTETINLQRASALCASDWGLWRTTTMNLDKEGQLAQGYPQLSSEQKAKVESQVNEILARLETEPKPFAWRLRDRVGDRVKWYKDVDEV